MKSNLPQIKNVLDLDEMTSDFHLNRMLIGVEWKYYSISHTKRRRKSKGNRDNLDYSVA